MKPTNGLDAKIEQVRENDRRIAERLDQIMEELRTIKVRGDSDSGIRDSGIRGTGTPMIRRRKDWAD